MIWNSWSSCFYWECWDQVLHLHMGHRNTSCSEEWRWLCLTAPRRATEDTAPKDHVLLQAQVLTQSFCFFKFLFVCLCTCQDTHVEIRGQLSGVSSLLPPGVQAYNGKHFYLLHQSSGKLRRSRLDFRAQENSFLFSPVVGTQIRALCMVGKHSSNEQSFTLHLRREEGPGAVTHTGRLSQEDYENIWIQPDT